MITRIRFAVAFLLAVSPVLAASDEPLHPAFVDEAMRDPFLTPTAISGPLDGERLEQDWDLDQGNWFAPPEEIFSDPDESCTTTAPATPTRRIPIYDTGLTATYLAPVEGFGVSDIDAKASLVFPVFVKGSPLRLAMGAGTTMISAPAGLDVPSQLYNFTAELRWFIPLKPSWGIDLGAGGGVFSDLSGNAGQGFRVTGRAILVKDLNPHWKLSGGILILGRKNLPAMPIAGAIYTPSDDVRVELLIPRARYMRRVRLNGNREHWAYAGVEVFGGNTWAVTQSNGAEDTFIYQDNRLIAGYEVKVPGGLAGRIEAGYVFMRHVKFSNAPTTLDPGGTVMVRAGVSY